MLGYDPERVEVLLYQLVHLTRGGEHAKMSKRRGDVVLLDEFVDEVGVDAARWYLVNRGPDQTIEIDVDLAAEKSEKNPVYYVQYAHARIAGILRNAGEARLRRAPAALARKSATSSSGSPISRASSQRQRNGAAPRDAEVRDPAGQRLPPFYHEHRVLDGVAWAIPHRLDLCTRDAARDRTLAAVDRGRRSRKNVSRPRGGRGSACSGARRR